MNRKQFVILLAVLAVLGGAGLLTYQKQNRERGSGNAAIGKKLLPDFPVNNVAHLAITQGTNQVNLVKKEDLWRVRERSEYPANYQQISELLLKIRDMKVTQTEEVGDSQLPRMGLATDAGSNAAVVMEFKDKDGKSLASVLLGKKHMRKSARPSPMEMGMGDEGFPDGRWIKVAGNARNIALVSDPLSTVEPKPEQWLSKDFFKVEKPKSFAVEYPSGTNSWHLTRETENGDWKLADAKGEEKVDSGKSSSLNYALNSPSFVDITTAKPEELGLDKPVVATVQTFDDFTYVLKTGAKTNDNYPLIVNVSAKIASERTPGKDEKPEDKAKLDKEFTEKKQKLEERLAQEKSLEKWVYVVSSWTLDTVMKDRHYWLAEKKEEKPADANGVTNAVHSVTDPLPTDLPAADPHEH